MKVDFPRWEEGDPIGWIACVERYFRFYRTVDATRVEITAITSRETLFSGLVEDEDSKPSDENLKPEYEAIEEEPQLADYAVHALAGYSNPKTMKVGGLLKQQLITILIDMGNTNNFLNSKVTAYMVLQIEGYNKFDIKVADGRILNCDQRCSRVKWLLQDQEVVADFFLLPIDDYEAAWD
ncbi:hypothetical protein BHE74_00036742 [Ensete ventricosum]|nr:hypothetical protein BHE74_00036742 [Ensete ventricosum]RZS09785.1 hypothetical protein BHM03_00040903 [Ensete ventricosum]